MTRRSALTLVEIIVVLAILAVLIGLLLPAVQSARERTREAACKNNLHQLNIAIGHYVQAHERLPPRGTPSMVGGWSIEILPFIEESNLYEMIPLKTAIADAPTFLVTPPTVFRCPVHTVLDNTPQHTVHPAHYAIAATSGRESYTLYEVPLELSIPWASGPELDRAELTQLTGPHQGGYFYASGFQHRVDYLPNSSR